MALNNLYQGRTRERDQNGITVTVTYTGTKSECEAWEAQQTIGATYAGLGKLASTSVQQREGSIYVVVARYQNANGTSGAVGSEVVPPDYTFGEFSATLDCSMLSTPLEQHPSYHKNWNNYLIGRMAVGGTPPGVPPWWSYSVAQTVIPASVQDIYRWCENESEKPLEQGYTWITVALPTKPGVTSYDRALYTLTESARFRTWAEAVAAVDAYADKRGTPINNPGAPFVDGKWKCDRANVRWSGEYWLGTLTWTYSPDGWDSDLYSAVPAST